MIDPKAPPQRDELQEAARTLGLTVVLRDLKSANGLSEAVEALAREPVDVVIVLQTTMLLSLRKAIAPLMAAKRLPAVYGYRQHVDEGGLVSYGVNLGWCWQHLATYVHKILSGASPADLPVEFPPRLQLVVSQKVATSLGLNISPTLLARADEVIE
jgi:putative ABC transport system substrate-binding protein